MTASYAGEVDSEWPPTLSGLVVPALGSSDTALRRFAAHIEPEDVLQCVKDIELSYDALPDELLLLLVSRGSSNEFEWNRTQDLPTYAGQSSLTRMPFHIPTAEGIRRDIAQAQVYCLFAAGLAAGLAWDVSDWFDDAQAHLTRVAATLPAKTQNELQRLRALMFSSDSDETRATWDELKRELDEDRPSYRRLFRD